VSCLDDCGQRKTTVKSVYHIDNLRRMLAMREEKLRFLTGRPPDMDEVGLSLRMAMMTETEDGGRD
jgi:hypothetical protein